MKKRDGFTLAEVLVTIGILGVVAALTLPALLNNTDKHTWANGLRTVQSILTNGFAQMMAVEGVDTLEDTELWGNVVTEAIIASNSDVRTQLGKYFTITHMETRPLGAVAHNPIFSINGGVDSDADESIRITLANSMDVYMRLYPSSMNKKNRADCQTIKSNGGNLCNRIADVYVDVNGAKSPNTFGKDIYRFILGADGRLFPMGGRDINLYDNSFAVWQTNCSGKQISKNCNSADLTARVIDEGYKINY